jgi:hypothetical protein
MSGQPKSTWAGRRNPLLRRESKRWRRLYRGRAAVEREFGRLKHEFGLTPYGFAELERVAGPPYRFGDAARLSQALARARADPVAA